MPARAARTPAQLGAAIRGARQQAGLTQAELAERAGVSRRWLLMLENGKAPGAELAKVMRTLEVLGLGMTVGATPEMPAEETELVRLLDEDDL